MFISGYMISPTQRWDTTDGKYFFTILDYTGSATSHFADPEFDGEPALITEQETDEAGRVKKEKIIEPEKPPNVQYEIKKEDESRLLEISEAHYNPPVKRKIFSCDFEETENRVSFGDTSPASPFGLPSDSTNLSLRRTLYLIVTFIRCAPLPRDHPSSLIQITKLK
jgi:hypothetical protein